MTILRQGILGAKGEVSREAGPITEKMISKLEAAVVNLERLLEDYRNESRSALAATDSNYARPLVLVATLANDAATAADVNPISLTGLVWTYEANAAYLFRWIGLVAPADVTTGCGFQLDVSGAVTEICMMFYDQSTNATGSLSGGHSIADDASASVSSGVGSTSGAPAVGHGMLRTGANPGTAQLRFRAAVAAVTTAKAGMTLVVERVA